MAEFDIVRIRYTWKGNWATTTAYKIDDIVKYGGSSYVCLRVHTASGFEADQDYIANPGDTNPTPAWSKMTDGFLFRGSWAQNTVYAFGDLTLYGGVVYVCTDGHTSGTLFATNNTKFSVYVSLYNFRENWTQNTRYGIGDLVRNGGIVYICNTEHTSSSTANGLEIDQAKWTVFFEGIDYKGEWSVGTKYVQNDLIKYGGSILRCIAQHTSLSSIDSTKFQTEFPGYKFHGQWHDSHFYAIGDMVQHGGWIYRSITNNLNKIPGDSIYQPVEVNWEVITKSINFVGDWSVSSSYKTGDVVRRGGYVYEALLDTTDDGSTIDYLDGSNWKLVSKGNFWRGDWNDGVSYAPGDTVSYLGLTYACNIFHLSTNQNFPGDNGSGYAYWDILIDTGTLIGMSERGDLLTYGLSRTLQGDESTLGPTRLAIGGEYEVLAVNPDNSVYYKEWGIHEKVVYVSADDNIALDDDTDPERGKSPFRPYRTIKFACEQRALLGADAELTTIKIFAGTYEEILPIIVPKKTALRGDELRSVTVKPKPANANLVGDLQYRLAGLNRIRDIIEHILGASPATPTAGNTETQQFSTYPSYTYTSYVPPQFDENGDEIFLSISSTEEDAVADSTQIVFVENLIDDLADYLQYHINNIGSAPAITGSNTTSIALNDTNAALLLRDNKNFLAAEAVAYVQQNFPLYNIDVNGFTKDVKRYVEAWANDVLTAGNYFTITAATHYKSEVEGSEDKDMFYLRDATGVRNMTLSGLTGTLPSNIILQNRRPTGGAYCSLDPGWGPNDENVWITTRSPYVQNVTTFGYAAVGQKIDGSLHNGGNKSIVSNDFTQVISDGIGAWVTNNGRAELVSVFTYYSHIGMFAENGGIIRATNGNSSYGNFGALSDNNDPTETPTFANVNNRYNQATIASAFAGEANDEILVFEYSNAGQNYSTASFTISGSGSGAISVFEETRDNAIFEAQVRNFPGDINNTPGGDGYSLAGNNAQSGDNTTITIASNDESTQAEILGLRIILTSGPGTGQYGYVDSYDELNKIVTVRKESTGELGWDHVVPGYPYSSIITTNTVYRFEPRPIFSDPGFTAENIDTEVGLGWANAVYGETVEVYTLIEGSAGTGITNGVTPAAAIFNVTKTARTYSITLVSGGAGYELYQTVTIDGADVGGLSGENDIVITVTDISDDSTNAIVGFTSVGIAQSGVFIITGSSGSTYLISYDGETWDSASLPQPGNWRCLAWGENTFVTIANNSNVAYTSTDGVNWTLRSLPSVRQWIDCVYGDSIFVAISSNQDSSAWSTNGVTWNAATIPDFGDSTSNEWVSVAYGNGKFIALANSNNASATGIYNAGLGTLTWSTHVIEVDDSTPKDWTSIAYGNGRFVAISSTGDVSVTFDGSHWNTTSAAMPSQDGSTQMYWKKIKYAQGVFFAICDTGNRIIGNDATTGPTNFAATSYDGINWTERTLAKSSSWTNLAFGNPDISPGDSTTISNNTGMWIILPESAETEINRVFTGAKALGRVVVESGTIRQIKIWEPGSGYLTAPTVTIIDPNNIEDAYVNCRTADKVLAQPAWSNRGISYRTSTTTVEVLGDGFADVIPNSVYIYIDNLESLPGPGAQFRFGGASGFHTVITEEIVSSQNGTFTAYFRITPSLSYDDDVQHNTEVEIRTRYSQVRITGHDFLDVGTGNFVQTNYPELYATGNFTNAPENEVLELNGGRVFYTSTDQSGNFRTGELFAVEQATGIVTISADFFDLQGLTELALGGVRLGGSGAVVREFSTDPLFTADSNNVVPTQRAIKGYLSNRLNVGGADLLTASFIAGTVKVGPDEIDNTANLSNAITVMADFSGPDIGISGSWLGLIQFTKSF